MVAAATAYEQDVDALVEEIGTECLALTTAYLEHMRGLARDLRPLVLRRDCARILAAYVQYVRDVEALSDGPAVGLADWVAMLPDEARP